MKRDWIIDETSVFYCKECNKIYNSFYELDNIFMCSRCFTEEIQPLSEKEIMPFIRKKRLQKLKEISEHK